MGEGLFVYLLCLMTVLMISTDTNDIHVDDLCYENRFIKRYQLDIYGHVLIVYRTIERCRLFYIYSCNRINIS